MWSGTRPVPCWSCRATNGRAFNQPDKFAPNESDDIGLERALSPAHRVDVGHPKSADDSGRYNRLIARRGCLAPDYRMGELTSSSACARSVAGAFVFPPR